MYDDFTNEELLDRLRWFAEQWAVYGDPSDRLDGIRIRLELENRGYPVYGML